MTASVTGGVPQARRPRRRSLWVRGALVAAAVVLLFVGVLPAVAGVSWSSIALALAAVPVPALAVLAGVWALGLLLHTTTLTAALPGLTRCQALMLSLTGSAVANVLPVGGAAGVALNYRMTRSWGHNRLAFAVYTVVTNVWDVAAKLALPLLVVPFLVTGAVVLPHALTGPLLWLVAAVGVLLVTAVVVASSPTTTLRLSAALDDGLRRLSVRLRLRRTLAVGSRLVAVRDDCAGVVHRGWGRLTIGIVTYTASLLVLLWLCCSVAGLSLALPTLVVVFVTERLLTLAGLTPGGAGIVEVGVVTVLTALGGEPVAAVSAVLLYRLFTFGIEIPVGALGLAGWLLRGRLVHRSASEAGEAGEVA